MKRMTAKKRLLVVFIAAVAVGATVALVFIFQFFGDAVRERSDLYISARTDYPGLLDSLRPRTDHHWAFDRYAGRLELERSFKPGHYVLEPGMNVVEIARMLKLGMQTPVRVTLNYARTRAFLASRLARQLDADSAELMRALTDPQLAREVGTDSLQLFSIFIPNTYEFYWTVSPEDFVRRMRKEYDRFWTPERDAARRRGHEQQREDAGEEQAHFLDLLELYCAEAERGQEQQQAVDAGRDGEREHCVADLAQKAERQNARKLKQIVRKDASFGSTEQENTK